MTINKMLICILLLGKSCFITFAQTGKGDELKPCFQDRAEKLQLLKRAEENQLNIRNIYILGNTFTRNRTFRKYMADAFNEGYIFSQRNLIKSIEGINRLKTIKPISLEDIEVQIEKDKVKDLNVIDFNICVEQKKK